MAWCNCLAVVAAADMNGSRVKKASGQPYARSAKAHDGTSHTKMTGQEPNKGNLATPLLRYFFVEVFLVAFFAIAFALAGGNWAVFFFVFLLVELVSSSILANSAKTLSL